MKYEWVGKETIHTDDKLMRRHRNYSQDAHNRKHPREIVTGDDISKNRRKSVKKYGVIWSTADWYFELVIDPETGEVIHYCNESLKHHQGHGTAKSEVSPLPIIESD